MVSLLQAFRWATIGDTPPTVAMVAVSLGASVAVLAIGLAYFRRTERTFADII
jgi:lipopolysaccharide transport system permease protein